MTSETAAVLMSGAVALATIGASVRQQERTLHHTRELADLESVRGELADATTTGVAHDLYEAIGQVNAAGAEWWLRDEGTEAWTKLGEQHTELNWFVLITAQECWPRRWPRPGSRTP